MLLLQEFEFDIHHRPGTQHAVADYLSRLENGVDAGKDDDDFPDGAILQFAAEDPDEEYTSHEDKWRIKIVKIRTLDMPML